MKAIFGVARRPYSGRIPETLLLLALRLDHAGLATHVHVILQRSSLARRFAIVLSFVVCAAIVLHHCAAAALLLGRVGVFALVDLVNSH